MFIYPFNSAFDLMRDDLSKYLSDPTEDVRVATETLLADFLREIRDVSIVRKRNEEHAKSKKEKEQAEPTRRPDVDKEKLPDITLSHPERAAFLQDHGGVTPNHEDDIGYRDEVKSEIDYRDNGGMKLSYCPAHRLLTL